MLKNKYLKIKETSKNKNNITQIPTGNADAMAYGCLFIMHL